MTGAMYGAGWMDRMSLMSVSIERPSWDNDGYEKMGIEKKYQ